MSDQKDKINSEVMKLLKMEKDDKMSLYKEFESLRNKYDDSDIVDAIYEKYMDEYKRIIKRALKIKEKLFDKYPNLEPREYDAKVSAYQKKYDFCDEERKIILKYIRDDKKMTLHDKDIRSLMPFTPLSKALGYKPQHAAYMTGEMKVSGNEMEHVNKIVKCHQENSQLAQRVQLQSLVYIDTELCALNGTVDRYQVSDVYSYIDPLLFALFIPKFDTLERRMLLTSIAKMIVTRKEGRTFQTQPEVDLFEDLCKDPSETQCTTEIAPYKDISKRCDVQTALWNCVLSLRQGRYYCNETSNLMNKLESCKNVIFDSPDFSFVKDVGHMVRKLFGVFSYRPIHIMTEPAQSVVNLGFSTSHMAELSVGVETTIPIMTCRMTAEGYDATPTPNSSGTDIIDFNTAVKGRNNIYMKGKHMVVKRQTVIYCNGILVFYVPRRYQGNTSSYVYGSMVPKELPITTTTLERVNNHDIRYCDSVTLDRGQTLNLRSVVVIETLYNELFGENGKEVIVGTSAMVLPKGETCGYYYSPIDGKCEPETLTDANYDKISPITAINASNFQSQATKYGTLFIYESETSESNTPYRC